MKKCKKCNIEKPFSDFHKNKVGKYGLENKCKQCVNDYYQNNKLKHQQKTKKYYHLNKEQWKYYPSQNNLITWGEQNPEKYRQYQNQYHIQRRQNNPLEKIKQNLRSRISSIIKNKGITKSKSLLEILGVKDQNILLSHIESLWTEGMNWDNYGNKKGQWSIDHIIPLDSAKNIDEVNKLNHYTNLQPLWWKDNIIKRNKMI